MSFKKESYNLLSNFVAKLLLQREHKLSGFMLKLPGWRNWQTRRTQNPIPARECGFDPLSGHQIKIAL